MKCMIRRCGKEAMTVPDNGGNCFCSVACSEKFYRCEEDDGVSWCPDWLDKLLRRKDCA